MKERLKNSAFLSNEADGVLGWTGVKKGTQRPINPSFFKYSVQVSSQHSSIVNVLLLMKIMAALSLSFLLGDKQSDPPTFKQLLLLFININLIHQLLLSSRHTQFVVRECVCLSVC